MNYYKIFLRGIRGIFTWESEKDISLGARVVVNFRNKPRVGIVLEKTEKPEFKTQEIKGIWDENFINEKYVSIAQELAYENFCSVEKILSLMIPEKFFLKKNPEHKEVFYQITDSALAAKCRGEKQKRAVEICGKGEVCSEVLEKEISKPVIKNLVKKKILKIRLGEIIPAKIGDVLLPKVRNKLTPMQKEASEKIWNTKLPVLLFGVTGSGKTEIYKKISEKVLADNQQAQILFLCPEIALTPQLIAEFRGVFAEKIAVWHSKLSAREKIQEWLRVVSGEAKILIGARSAALVPMKNPQLIILDEEHEWTFKNEFAPRFWTHDVAEKIEQKFCSRMILGSATPRCESFFKTEKKQFLKVDLPSRVFETKMPDIEIVNLKNEGKKGNFGPISEPLFNEMKITLERKKQVILFLNRRGFSGATFCKKCGHKFECPNCSMTMKLHKKDSVEKFICHICGRLESVPKKCPECGESDFEFRGWGTQMLENILLKKFPGVRILRADADSTTGKNDFDNILKKFHKGEADILCGTQMIAKGLDFENVETVGVILADVGLSLPDPRSEERVFSLLTQISGRAGRRERQGKVFIQTFAPEDNVFKFAQKQDAEKFCREELLIRESAQMPPFTTFAKITFSDVNKKTAFEMAQSFFKKLKIETAKLPKKENWEVHFAPAFFPRTFSKFHFHVFIRTNEKQDLINFLHKIEIPIFAKVDINPSTFL
jgi:primosomal protein N' (replication factor Y)